MRLQTIRNGLPWSITNKVKGNCLISVWCEGPSTGKENGIFVDYLTIGIVAFKFPSSLVNKVHIGRLQRSCCIDSITIIIVSINWNIGRNFLWERQARVFADKLIVFWIGCRCKCPSTCELEIPSIVIPVAHWFFIKIIARKVPSTIVSCIIVGIIKWFNRLNYILTFRICLPIHICPFTWRIYWLQIIDLSR
ncbi:hypothetical protein D8802_08810 [Streptococcus oralis]|uniref:Uncharacterized protein n=1 Tax=Streptococcus oralis TaxID=1303 RepID=A0A3R9L876_STROR|nr:hypothetical protein D8802_08810 [Streptococcus oralis]